jgi:hypothetical protein
MLRQELSSTLEQLAALACAEVDVEAGPSVDCCSA